MRSDQSESLAHFQKLFDEERDETHQKHQDAINVLKDELARVTAELTATITQLQSDIADLKATHETEMDKLIADKDAVIADTESRRTDIESKLNIELADLKKAFDDSQTKLMVPCP